MLFSPLKGLLSAQLLFGIAELSNAQQYAGENITTSLPVVPGAEITYFNIKDTNRKNTTLINYMSLNSTGQRPDPRALKRAVIVVHGLNRDPNTYMSNMLSALAQVTGHPEVSTDSVAILAPYFTNGDDKSTGGYPWVDGKGSTTSALVWKGSQWASGANNQYPKTQTTVSSYAVMDQLTTYFDNKTLFPNINQIVVAGHSLGAQTVQRYCEVGDNLSTRTPVVYWIGNPNSFGWMSLDRPIDYSSCPAYDDWRDGLSSYTNTYGATVVNAGRDAVLRNYNTKKIAYARGTLDLGDDSSGCGPTTTGANRHERFFNFIRAFPPTNLCTIDYAPIGHDAGSMFASPAGQARLFLDNFDGAGSKAFDFGYRLSVFSTSNITTDVKPSSPQQVGSYSLLGCYSEATSGRALSARSTSQVDMTVEGCAKYCSGYSYFGVEYGAEVS
ncbi:hypothetical protein SLS55_004190 [Diplodia seriata]|uniref:WSC domain-containing protein n=1 Tax=Diplodia seriata TaxID=420778 RepID=A0ABR3CIQ0_9PEZI